MTKLIKITLFLFQMFLSTSFINSFENRADVWNYLIKLSTEDKYIKYSFYASRLLFVYNPEIYIKSDMDIYNLYKNKKGFGAIYKKNVINNIKEMETYMEKGDKLDFSKIDLYSFKLVNNKYIIKNEMIDNYPFLDERIGTLFSILKRFDKKVTSLELAYLSYFCNFETSDNLWILYTDEKIGYLLKDGKLYKNGLEFTNSIIGNLLIVFNKDYVYSLLTDRDDREKSNYLKLIVEKYQKDKIKNKVSDSTEFETIKDIAIITKLEKEEDFLVAKISSLKANDISIFNNPDFNNINENDVYFFLNNVMFFSNLLNPFSFYFSRIKIDNNISEKEYLIKIFEKYRLVFYEKDYNIRISKKNGNKIEGYINNYIWPDIFRYDIEDNLLTKGGICRDNVLIAAGILKLFGIEYYDLGILDHGIIWIPELDIFYSNGETFDAKSKQKYFEEYINYDLFNKNKNISILNISVDSHIFYFVKSNEITKWNQLEKNIINRFLDYLEAKMPNVKLGQKYYFNEIYNIKEVKNFINDYSPSKYILILSY